MQQASSVSTSAPCNCILTVVINNPNWAIKALATPIRTVKGNEAYLWLLLHWQALFGWPNLFSFQHCQVAWVALICQSQDLHLDYCSVPRIICTELHKDNVTPPRIESTFDKGFLKVQRSKLLLNRGYPLISDCLDIKSTTTLWL